MQKFIVIMTVGVGITVFYTICFIYNVFIRKTFFSKKEGIKYSDRYKKIWDIIMAVILAVFLVVCYVSILIPYTLDIKYIISDDYPVTNGIIKTVSHKDNGEKVVLDNDFEILIMTSRHLFEGEEVEIRYLPNLERGELVDND